MYCNNCGSQNPDNSKFCANCGESFLEKDTLNDTQNKVYSSMEELKQLAYSGDTHAQYVYGASLAFDVNSLNNEKIILYDTWKDGAKWLRKSADNGEVNALICLTRIYEANGDSGKLFMAYNELSDKFNNAYGQYKLGIFYQSKDNYSKAYYYYDKAAQNGNEDAIFLMKHYNPDFAPIDTHPDKSYAVYGLLAIFLGGYGIHNFYAGQTKKGIIKIVLTLTLVGFLVSELWGIYEGIIAIVDKNIHD